MCGHRGQLGHASRITQPVQTNRGIGGDPKILSMLNTFPRPNSFASGDGLNTAAYFWNSSYKVRGPNIMGRIDHTINDKSSIFGRYLFADHNTLGGDPNNGRPVVFPGFPPMGEVFRRSHNLAVSYRRVISPRIVNEFTAGFSRFMFLFTQGEANPNFPDVPPYSFSNISYPYRAVPRTNRAVTTPQILDNLSERERKVLIMRFGLEDGVTRTLEDVGKEFNVTRERVRQIEAKALRKLRHPLRSRKLRDYLA